jgi:hypothetical protein
MNESRIDMVWRHMAQMFGADALQRKFGDLAPDDWRQFVNRLSEHELKRGLRRMVNSGKSFPPTLPEFLKMAHEVGGDYPGDDRYQQKQLSSPTNTFDGWDAMAGQHLMAHILRCAQKREYFDAETTLPLVGAKNLWAEEMRGMEKAGTKPADHGKKLWNECLAKANLSISYIKSQRGEEFIV